MPSFQCQTMEIKLNVRMMRPLPNLNREQHQKFIRNSIFVGTKLFYNICGKENGSKLCAHGLDSRSVLNSTDLETDTTLEFLKSESTKKPAFCSWSAYINIKWFSALNLRKRYIIRYDWNFPCSKNVEESCLLFYLRKRFWKSFI